MTDPTLIAAANTPIRDGEWIYHELVQTWVVGIQYDWNLREGALLCRGPVDMDGTIHLFQSIDVGVKTIYCLIDKKPDIRYSKRDDGEWIAECFR